MTSRPSCPAPALPSGTERAPTAAARTRDARRTTPARIAPAFYMPTRREGVGGASPLDRTGHRFTRCRKIDSMVHMKRTNLVLDEHLLDEALRLSGERTYSKAVGRALAEFVRRMKVGRILQLAGSGLWDGDLAEMRGDRPRPSRRERRDP